LINKYSLDYIEKGKDQIKKDLKVVSVLKLNFDHVTGKRSNGPKALLSSSPLIINATSSSLPSVISSSSEGNDKN
jgi:hypothetical protein